MNGKKKRENSVLENANLKSEVWTRHYLKIYPEIYFPLFFMVSLSLYVYLNSNWIRQCLGELCQMGSVRKSFQKEAKHMGSDFRRETWFSREKRGRTFQKKGEAHGWWVVSKFVQIKQVLILRVQRQWKEGPWLKSPPLMTSPSPSKPGL